jgi:hypothetical protein
VHARPSVAATAFRMNCPNFGAQRAIGPAARRAQRAAPPRVIPDRADVQDLAHRANRVMGLLRQDERERHSLCLAKKAAPFLGCRAPHAIGAHPAAVAAARSVRQWSAVRPPVAASPPPTSATSPAGHPGHARSCSANHYSFAPSERLPL